MLPLYVLLFLPILVAAQGSQSSVTTTDRETLRNDASKNALDWIGESFLNAADALYPASRSCNRVEERKKKYKLNKYILPLIVGFMLIKSILLPITLKALAVLSGKAIVLSLMSLILAAIVGLKKVAQKETGYDKHRRQDTFDFVDEIQEVEPYRLYKERRRKK